jgi:hypothetical protein
MKVHSVLLGFLLVACTDKGDDTSGGGGGGGDDSNPPAGEDADNDGFDVEEDCNDGDAAINPDAEEICDGVDNDCADGIDVGATDATAYYADGDADGFGAGAGTEACEPVAGQVDNDDDCDDANNAIHPDAIEICDELDTDEDCDALIDDDDDSLDTSTATVTVYVDGDGDGYGADGTKLTVCDVTAGYSESPGDCDDASSAANPGAAEVCGDIVDEDCDGEARSCGYSGAIDPLDAYAHIRGYPSIYLGTDTTPTGDLDGDGDDDLAVATSFQGVFLFAGPISGTLEASKDTMGELTNTTSGDGIGHDVQGIGDQDGDGYDDLMVEAYSWGGVTGRAYIVLGPMTGAEAVDEAAVATITGATSGDYMSWYPSAGDVNGDGIIDPMLGSPGPSGTPGDSYIFFGPVTSGDLSAADADASFIGITNDDWTGGQNAANGDVDGDGTDDVLVSAEQTDYTGSDDGAVWLFYGPVGGEYSVDEADTLFYGAPSGTHLGWFSAINGDLDGDGLDDVVLSAPSGGDGIVYIVYADAVSGSSEVDVAKAEGYIAGDPGSYQTFGNYVDAGGDIDSNGTDELTVCSAGAGGGTGIAWTFYGPISGSFEASADAGFTVTGDAGQGMGSSCVFVGDVTADGADDLAIGAANTTIGGSYGAGIVLLLNGMAK